MCDDLRVPRTAANRPANGRKLVADTLKLRDKEIKQSDNPVREYIATKKRIEKQLRKSLGLQNAPLSIKGSDTAKQEALGLSITSHAPADTLDQHTSNEVSEDRESYITGISSSEESEVVDNRGALCDPQPLVSFRGSATRKKVADNLCPECEDYKFADSDRGYKTCPQCKSHLLIKTLEDGSKAIVPVKGFTKQPSIPKEVVLEVVPAIEIPTLVPLRCIICGDPVEKTLSVKGVYTKMLQPMFNKAGVIAGYRPVNKSGRAHAFCASEKERQSKWKPLAEDFNTLRDGLRNVKETTGSEADEQSHDGTFDEPQREDGSIIHPQVVATSEVYMDGPKGPDIFAGLNAFEFGFETQVKPRVRRQGKGRRKR